MKQEIQEKSAFLQHQERIMAARAQQDRDIAERQKYTLTPAAQESPARSDLSKTVIARDNLETGETTHRVVERTPVPTQRFIKPAPLTLDEVREQLVNAGNTIDSAKEKYQTDVASLDAFYAEQNALKAEIIELLAKVNEKKAKLQELESAGTPKDRYLSAIVKSEVEVVGIAGSLFTTPRRGQEDPRRSSKRGCKRNAQVLSPLRHSLKK